MNQDDLRDRLSAIDPARTMATEPPTTTSSKARLELIMRTEATTPTTTSQRPSHLGRWIAGAAAAGVLAVGGFALAGSGDSPETGPAMDLALGGSDAMASCMPVSADILGDMPLAFAGTATTIEGETVTLTVDEWYVGGDAGTVVLHSESGMEALIDGFAFVEGGDYLVSASEGTVNFCGYSGPATPELEAVYTEAFGS